MMKVYLGGVNISNATFYGGYNITRVLGSIGL